MSEPTGPELSRRATLQGLGATTASLALGCRNRDDDRQTPTPAPGRIVGADAEAAHRVREIAPAPPATSSARTVLVVGAGVAGLSAAWRLRHAGVTDVEVIELGHEPGGTSRSGQSNGLVYPWGAHYLPVPNPETRAVLRLCDEVGLTRGRDAEGRPRFDPRHLVFEPEDRLFFRGKWYEGLYLGAGATDQDLRQREAFEHYARQLREATGADGRPAFALPAALSSRDPRFTALDRMTMADFLRSRGWTSPRLRWTIDYACRDDYGADATRVSAWAALHYFVGRRPIHTPETQGSQYLTWPEGNARLVTHLRQFAPRLTSGRLALRAEPDGRVLTADIASGKTLEIRAEHVVLAVPSHVAHRLTGGRRGRFGIHAPWVVANLILERDPRVDHPSVQPPAWNNVLYDSPSVGYVSSTHQRFGPQSHTVWSWYRPFPPESRGRILTAGHRALAEMVLGDLGRAHREVRQRTERIDIWRWGHGTLIPAPGLITGDGRHRATEPLGRLHFAHTDLSGLPLFEEAQYRGVVAAQRILDDLGIPHETWV